MSNLVKRTISSLILAPLFLYLMYIGGTVFEVLILVIGLIGFYEWVMITRRSKKFLLWFLFGFVYISFAILVFLFLSRYRIPFAGFNLFPVHLFVIVMIVWINDICGYIFGKSIGGPKLCPRISPNKTWAGAIGGIIGSMLFFFIMNYSLSFGAGKISDKHFYNALMIHLFIPIIAQIGDLFESWMKRKFDVKDSGTIIPGHGGVLDRIDGLLLVLNVTGIFFYILLYDQVSKML